MMQEPAAGGRQEWFSAAELAERALPGLPASKFGVQKLAERGGRAKAQCNVRGPLARQRRGRGGGLEYHVSLLPETARTALALAAVPVAERLDRDSLWMRWERLPVGPKAEALRRLGIIEQVEHLIRHGMRKGAAVTEVAKRCDDVSCSSIYEWMGRIHGVEGQDRAAYLAPDYAGRTAVAACHPEAWEFYKADFLRQSRLSHAHCYRNLAGVAAAKGWDIPSAKTLQRRLEAEIPATVQTFLRYGDQALAHAYPHLERDRSGILPMQVANLDGHTWDVNVEWEDGSVGRPLSLAVQDIASGKVLALRFGLTLNHHLVRLAIGDMVRDYGVVDTMIMDNGRENAAKAISGGQARNRWKATEEEPDGLLKLLGVKAVFATPYWGQAKPIERAFRDFAHGIAKLAAFEGAYTGHNPVSKRENHGSRAIPIAEFEAIVRRELLEHNARRGRTGSGMRKRSFDDVFAEGIARRPARRVTPEQLRLCLLASKPVSMDRRDHAVRVEGHRYWSPELGALKAQRVIVRFDPEALDRPAYVYSLDGRFLAEAECMERGSFNSVSQAQTQKRNVRDFKRAIKAEAAALRRMQAADVEAAMAEAAGPAPEPIVPADEKVVRPDFAAPRSAEQLGQGRKDPKDFNANWQRGVDALLGTG